ncbi:MAG TPA: hypothetical protein VM425_14785 [Myxococcota bacterium]|nr:hypothetical protein [Myxococcota bacterium]
MAIDDSSFDKRVIQRSLTNGGITKKDYERYIGALKDMSAELEICEARLSRLSKKLPTKVMDEDDEL